MWEKETQNGSFSETNVDMRSTKECKLLSKNLKLVLESRADGEGKLAR